MVVNDTAQLEERISSGAITQQKAWQFIRELNATEERLGATAIVDTNRTYTYRQFFRMWDEYAEVFSGLGISERNGSRVGILATISVPPVAAMYALNMMGVSVSMLGAFDFLVESWICNAIEVEHITDLVLPDTIVRPNTLHTLMTNASRLGLRHVILVHTSKDTGHLSKEARQLLKLNYQYLKQVPGVLAFSDLRRRYEATPIAYGSGENDEAAVIVHTSGTTKGTHKPVPLSDHAFNAAVARLLVDERFSALRGNATVLLEFELAYSYPLIEAMHLPLAYGCSVVFDRRQLDQHDPSGDNGRDIKKMGISVMFTALWKCKAWMEHPKRDKFDFSGVKLVVLGGVSVSEDQFRRLEEFFAKHGGHPALVNGYGLAECGAAATLSVYDGTYRGIGKPLSGVTLRIFDEEAGVYHNPEDGPCTGVLYIASDSASSGRIDDTTFFELQDVDGTAYLNTHDLVRVDENGNIFCLGRENRCFVNNDGIRFDAGRVEAALSAMEGIDECAVVGMYQKIGLHDTVPVLYARVSSPAKHRKKTLRKALVRAYVDGGLSSDTTLPWRCVIVEALPHNEMGKVDVLSLSINPVEGRELKVVPVERGDQLVDVRLERITKKERADSFELVQSASVPDETKRNFREFRRNCAGLMGPLADGGMQPVERREPPRSNKSLDGKRLKAKRKKKKGKKDGNAGKGLMLPEPIYSTLRVAFIASNVDYTYEE